MPSVDTPNISSTAGLHDGSFGLPADADVSRPAGNGSAPEMLQSVTQGAHQTIDRLAEQVMPHVQRLQENMGSATEMLDQRADQIREMTDEWLETLRCTVRDNPLASLGAALAVGLLVARLSR